MGFQMVSSHLRFNRRLDLAEGKDASNTYWKWTKNRLKWDAKTDIVLDANAPSLNHDSFYINDLQNCQQYFTSQVGQSEIIASFFDGKRDGFFVDLAANHYKELSNTYALEKCYHWKGICIEPNAEYRKGILENRLCKLAVNPVSSYSGQEVKFKMDGPMGGIVNDEIKATNQVEILETVTLNNLLAAMNAPSTIDYLSLDVEGYEHHVLKHFDFGLYTILTMSIERPPKILHDHLSHHGYWFVTQLRHPQHGYFGECIYMHSTHAKFEGVMNKYRSNLDPSTTWSEGMDRNGNGGETKFQMTPAWPK